MVGSRVMIVLGLFSTRVPTGPFGVSSRMFTTGRIRHLVRMSYVRCTQRLMRWWNGRTIRRNVWMKQDHSSCVSMLMRWETPPVVFRIIGGRSKGRREFRVVSSGIGWIKVYCRRVRTGKFGMRMVVILEIFPTMQISTVRKKRTNQPLNPLLSVSTFNRRAHSILKCLLAFLVNGMVGPDRVPHPAMIEFKKLVQPVDFEREWHGDSFGEPIIHVFNRRFFTTLDDLAGVWSLKINGFVVEEHEFSLPKNLHPQSKEILAIPSLSKAYAYHKFPELLKSETAIHIDFRVFSNGGRTPALEVASEQIQVSSCRFNLDTHMLPYLSRVMMCEAPIYPEVERNGKLITLSSGGFLVNFTTASADFEYVSSNSSQTLVKGLRPNLFRAGTDNDGVKQLETQFDDQTKPLGQWLSLGLDCVTLENVKREVSSKVLCADVFPERDTEKECPSVETEATIISWPGKVTYDGIAMAQPLKSQNQEHIQRKLGSWKQTVTMNSDGALYVENTITLDGSLVKDLPRWGVEFAMPRSMSHNSFLARGPHENYADRHMSAHIGVYEENVPECPSTYVVPQEQGNRMGLNWL
mmetsp:Transcript_10320/g.18966  ORF Transcript_10320/g.18966 Transcript_10320/m.18966 type:complete len:580 (+) Transcript_10320:1828-3567(+)